MNIFHEDQAAWLARVDEEIIDPQRPIIDPHHHLWPKLMGHPYNVDELVLDTGSGHNVVGTVFMECSACYREDGPEHEKSLGETEFVLARAARIRELKLGPPRPELRHLAERPPTSDELLAAQRPCYEPALQCFGPDRCMFESNFPVDRLSLSYTVYFNAMKKPVAEYSESEKDALFQGTARRVYRL
jgi:hypothetical protein